MIATIGWSSFAMSAGMVLLAMYIIKYACDSFEDASDYLGTEVYKMAPGVRGATIEAIASSLPELFTTMFLLFVFNDVGGFAAGVATCAGSAVFNAVIIPAVCILAVTIKGVNGKKIDKLKLQSSTIVRDGIFFILAELCLILFLGTNELVWWMGLALMGIYCVYFAVLMRGMGGDGTDDSEDDEDDEDDEDEEKGLVGSIFTFDFNKLFFGGKDFTPTSAWVVVLSATATIAAACYLLSESVILSAKALNVEPYFTAVIFGAAATSVPDTVISYKDAMKGDYDDAVANAVGSNIFDICVALGFPLALYSGLQVFNGNSGVISLANDSSQGSVQDLRIVLVVLSVIIVGLFLSAPREKTDDNKNLLLIGKNYGFALLCMYALWTGFIIQQIMTL